MSTLYELCSMEWTLLSECSLSCPALEAIGAISTAASLSTIDTTLSTVSVALLLTFNRIMLLLLFEAASVVDRVVPIPVTVAVAMRIRITKV